MKTNFLLAILFVLPILLGLYWFMAPHDGAFGWMPEHINDTYGDKIDLMYLIIFWVVAVMFFLTEGFLVYAIYAYRAREGHKATYSHGSKKAELMWAVIPGLMLLALAIGQSGTWAEVRYTMPDEDDPNTLVVQVFAEQFNWNFRYNKTDRQFGTDDEIALRELVVPAGKKVLLNMASKDVIHSLFLPHVRFKQDLTPGMLTQAWFSADKIAVWNIQAQLKDSGAGKTDKYDYIELLTVEEFLKKKVATNWDKTKALAFQNEEVEGVSRRRFWYDVEPGTQVEIWQNGAVTTASAAEAEYVLHSLDLACAELCGPQHYTMASKMVILPEAMFNIWLERQTKTDANKLFEDVWDKSYPHYNKKP